MTPASEPNPEAPGRISARARRMAIAAGDSGSSAGICTSPTACSGIGRGPQHELPGAPIVNPDRRAIGAEQAVGAVAEDVEPGGQLQRRRQALRELVEQQPQIAPAAGRAGAGGRARAPSETRRPSARRPVPSDAGGAPLKPMATMPMRSPPRASGSSSAARARRRDGEVGHLAVRVGHAAIGAPRANASATIAASCGRGRPGVGREGRRGRSPRWPASRRCAGCARRAASGCRRSRRARAGAAAAAGRRGAACARAARPAAAGAGRRAGRRGIGVGGRTGQSPRSGVSGHLCLVGAGAASARNCMRLIARNVMLSDRQTGAYRPANAIIA